MLLSFFQRRIKDRAEAEDLAQEVFLRMLRRGNIATLADARSYRAVADAEAMFRGCLRKSFPDLSEAEQREGQAMVKGDAT